MKALLIAEKPSLMRDIQATYQENRERFSFEIDFISQAGHLVGLKKPDEIDEEKYGKWKLENFPIDVPYVYKPTRADLLGKIRTALKSGQYDFVIHAGDPEPEGELLVNLVLNYLGNTLPVKRFWINAQTHGEILSGLLNLKDDSEYQNIYKSALVRQHTDYQFGMNITGVATLKLGDLYKLGRVKAAIIRMHVDRELAIRNFVQKSSWKRAFEYNQCLFVNETEYETKEEALANIPNAKYAVVTKIKDEVKNYKAPKLYNLSTLQTDAYKRLGYSGAETLELLQHLYEAQITTYPRTDCEYISSNVELEQIVPLVASKVGLSGDPFLPRISAIRGDKSYVNDKAISQEGHTAIMPTGEGNFSGIGPREMALYELIARHFLAVFAPPKKVRNLAVTAALGGDTALGDFVYKESSDVEAGYELIIDPNYEMKTGNNVPFSDGQTLDPINLSAKECVTKPPARYNEGSLIKALTEIEYKDHEGNKILYSIGTQATRSKIIEECVNCGYITKNKGVFAATLKAEKVVAELGDLSLFDVKNSGRWESLLEQIRRGEISASAVEKELLNECHEATEKIKSREIEKYRPQAEATVLGKCPKCGANVVSGKFGAYCIEKCGMQVSKAMGKALSDSQIKSLLQGKKTLVKGLTSKTGKKYNAYLTPAGIESFSYKGQDGSAKSGFGFKFKMDFQ